jgi:lipid-A-disaccharide synthase
VKSKKESLKIMLIAGEASGDLHGAELVKEIKRLRPGTRVFGLGGPRMARAGMRLDLDLASKSVIGLVEVFKHILFFKRAFRLAQRKWLEEQPDLVVPIDYPGFNLRFSKWVHQQGGRVAYYISPQVWAWKAGRVHQMKKYLRKILVIFPFEAPLYKKAGLDCAFVGHPLKDQIGRLPPAARVRRQRGWGKNEKLVGLLPGSREQELKWLLPVMLKTALAMNRARGDLRFLILKAPHLPQSLFRPSMKAYEKRLKLELVQTRGNQDPYALRQCFDLALVASGTATLETALLGTPFMILYRVNPLSYQIGKRLVKLKYIGLANVVAGKKVVPEFIQGDLDPERMSQEALSLLGDARRRREQIGQLKRANRFLGKPGASLRAAQEILALAAE